MSKQHPIRRMADRVEKCSTLLGVERSLARSIEPLLDALDTFGHSSFHNEDPDKLCPACRLLAAWKEPIG